MNILTMLGGINLRPSGSNEPILAALKLILYYQQKPGARVSDTAPNQRESYQGGAQQQQRSRGHARKVAPRDKVPRFVGPIKKGPDHTGDRHRTVLREHRSERWLPCPRQHARVRVEGATVILMLVLGSICGGVCAYLRLKRSLSVRLFTGLIGGAVSVWLYVYLGLPFLDASVAHNITSVLFVALIGGYAGTEVIDVFSKKLLKA